MHINCDEFSARLWTLMDLIPVQAVKGENIGDFDFKPIVLMMYGTVVPLDG